MVSTKPICEPYQGLGTSTEILIALLDGRMMASEVCRIADYRTGLSKLRQFLDVGLVTLTIEDNWRHTNWYELTEKGRKAAELMAEAKKVIET